MAAFAVAPEAELEEAVYDGAGRTPDELDALTARVYERYTIGTPKERWMSIPLMYEDPFYDVNYVYGAIVGLRIYARLARDPGAFVALMKNGYDAPPASLLQRFFGIALDAPIDDVVQLLTARIEAYAR
jgi:oligoendopeptidase F